MSISAALAIGVFVVAYALIATEKLHRVAVALGGAVAMFLIGATNAQTAFFSPSAGIDWNVLALLLGMMLIVSVLARTGLFEFLAIWAVKRARGQPIRVMTVLVLVTAGASALLDNVTTILLIAPVTLVVCDRMRVPVAPYLIAEALASNIGGTATLVGDPPNIIIASRAGLSYDAFLIHLAPLVLVLVGVFLAVIRVMFRHAFDGDADRAAEIMAMDERHCLTDRRLLVVSLTVLAMVTVAFVLHTVLHVEPSVVALIGGLVLLALSRLDARDVVADVEWPTLVFFAGLFVMVGGLVNTGVIDQVSRAAADAAQGRLAETAVGLMWGSAAISAVVDNIPYVATMAPVVQELVASSDSPQAGSLWWALALGADLGGNATAVGASANVVAIGLAEKAGHRITFWGFTKNGLIVTAITMTVATPYLIVRYFLLA